MLDLFKEYVRDGRIPEALLVGQNMLIHSSDPEVFSAYMDLLCELVGSVEDRSLAADNLEQANGAFSYYACHAPLDRETVEALMRQRRRLDDLRESLRSEAQQEEAALRAEQNRYIQDSFSLIDRLAEHLAESTDDAELKKTMQQIKAIDSRLDRSNFNEAQATEYERLTRKCSENVARQTGILEHSREIDYNQKAADAFERAFRLFSSGTEADKRREILDDFFSFDPARLFSETLTYYQHVYSYIFSKLPDEEKFAFTKLAIRHCKR